MYAGFILWRVPLVKKGQRPKRKGSSHPRPRRQPRPRPGTVTVYQIHCKACKRRYELAGFAEVNFCTFCRSDQIEKAIRNRKEEKGRLWMLS